MCVGGEGRGASNATFLRNSSDSMDCPWPPRKGEDEKEGLGGGGEAH